jgi:hypothetical protein
VPKGRSYTTSTEAASGFASPDTEGVPSHESFPRDELESVMADMAEAKSQQNVQKRGFELLYTRAILVRQS